MKEKKIENKNESNESKEKPKINEESKDKKEVLNLKKENHNK